MRLSCAGQASLLVITGETAVRDLFEVSLLMTLYWILAILGPGEK